MTDDPLVIPVHILEEMISHCREVYPNEACGMLSGEGREVATIHKMTNVNNSPVRYEMDSREQFKAQRDMRVRKYSLLGIYHSHPSTAAYPSHTDVERALWDGRPLFEDVVYLIISLAEEAPTVKAFSIREGGVKEVGITVRGRTDSGLAH